MSVQFIYTYIYRERAKDTERYISTHSGKEQAKRDGGAEVSAAITVNMF